MDHVVGNGEAGKWPWPKVALVAMAVHLTAVAMFWLRPSFLGVLLLAPGVLIEELVSHHGTRGGLSVVKVASSALVFAALAVLVRARPRLGIPVGVGLVIGGLAVMMAKILRAIGGP